MYCTDCWGSHWFWVMPVLLMILMFVCATVMMRRSRSWRWGGDHVGWMPLRCWAPGRGPTARRWSETASQILERRYAGGEIAKEEYEQIKHDIESSS